MSSTLLELKFPDPDNTNPTLLNEFQKFMKEKSGDSYLPISEKKYLEFVEILRGFWENFFNIHSIPYNNGFSVFIRFMSEGLTEASVFRVEADIVGDKAKETVFICKYDTIEKINKEVKNKNIVIRRKEKIFPIFELPYTKEGFDKSILAMNSAMDSNLAETIFTAIKYILSESERDKTLREYYQKEISSTLSTVYKALFEVFYNTKKGQIYIENSIQDLFSEYLDYNRLDKNPPHPEHGVFTEKLKKAQNETGESIEISSFFSDMEDFNALLAGLAIHKDLNPNNILIAIGEDRTAAPMIIDFFEMQSLDSHDGNNWLPLFFDYARLEAQISLYFFYDIQNQEPSLSNQELYQAFTEFIEKLNSGKYVKIEGNYPNIKTSSLQFLYYILFSLRKYIFKLMHEDKPEIKKELIFKNYLFTLTSFYFTFPKMNLEEGIETKWNLSLLGAIHSKKQLLSLKEGLDYEALYNPSKSEELNIEKNRREYLEKYTNKYIPLENNTKQILEFLVSESKSHLFIEASPGMGKSSLMAYTTEVLNGNLLNHSFPDNFYCIPVFLGDDKSSNFKPIFSDREESITSNILGYFISVLIHTFTIHIFEEWKKSTQIELFKNICSEVNSWLYHQGKKLIFLIDSIQDEENWESYILFNLSTNFKYILSARPKEELHNLITEKSTQKIELTNFSDTDIYALGEIYNIPFTESHISLLMEKTNGYPIYIR
ncbi:MAG: hypothetical protein KDK36_03480, partial [Leptospiraceae bacterium]|nr:hypothetical protein [Leptospiraceae bacterium]